MIDELVARQLNKCYKITGPGYSRGVDSPADDLTKVEDKGVLTEEFGSGVIKKGRRKVGRSLFFGCSGKRKRGKV